MANVASEPRRSEIPCRPKKVQFAQETSDVTYPIVMAPVLRKSITSSPSDPCDVYLNNIAADARHETDNPARVDSCIEEEEEGRVTLCPCVYGGGCLVTLPGADELAAKDVLQTSKYITDIHDLGDRLLCWTTYRGEEVKALFEASAGIDRRAENEDIVRLSDGLDSWANYLACANAIFKRAKNGGKIRYRSELMSNIQIALRQYRELCRDIEELCSWMRKRVDNAGRYGCSSRAQWINGTKAVPLARPLGRKLKLQALKFELMVMELRRYQQTSSSGLRSHEWLP